MVHNKKAPKMDLRWIFRCVPYDATFLIKPMVAKKLRTKLSNSLKYVVKTQMTQKNSTK